MRVSLWTPLLFTVLLSMIPVPDMLVNAWPAWLVLFFFWLNVFSNQQSIYLWVWLLGLIYDLLQGTTLGGHVIALSVLNILISAHRHKFIYYPTLQQSMLVWLGCILYLLSSQLYLFDLSFTRFLLHIVQVSVATAAIWPWLEFYLTRPVRRG